ncbi:hypothetical protein GCM10022379_18460 [Micromonospora maritima]
MVTVVGAGGGAGSEVVGAALGAAVVGAAEAVVAATAGATAACLDALGAGFGSLPPPTIAPMALTPQHRRTTAPTTMPTMAHVPSLRFGATGGWGGIGEPGMEGCGP